MSQEEKVVLRQDGKAVFQFGGVDRTLRPPRLGEHKQLKARLVELASEADVETKLRAAARAGDPVAIFAAADDSDTAVVTIMREMFYMLKVGGPDLPDGDDDLPTWFAVSSLPQELMSHWRAVPLDRGSPATPLPR